jgi:hypothetical protein
MDDDFDVSDFDTGSKFIRKEDLKADGPQRKRIQTVEQRESQFDKDKPGKPVPELVLVFTDGTRFGLRAKDGPCTERREGGRDSDSDSGRGRGTGRLRVRSRARRGRNAAGRVTVYAGPGLTAWSRTCSTKRRDISMPRHNNRQEAA